MFQRQLSTTALGNPKRSPTSSSHRLFQRQATASQIIPSLSSTGATTSPLQIQQLQQTNDGQLANKQRVSSMLANVKDSPANDCSSSAIIRNSLTANSSTTRRTLAQVDSLDMESSTMVKKASEEQLQKQQKKMAKNKRIISRMLSISAIHTTVTGAVGSSSGSNNFSPAHIANNTNNGSLIRGVISTTTSNNNNDLNNTASLDNASKTTTTNDLKRQLPGEISCLNYFFSSLWF